jgi:hypothetical protein
MIGFYNQVGTAGLTNWAQGSNQQIAFGRGDAGFVAINNEDWEWTSTFQTSLSSGTYCDVASGKKEGNNCTGGRYDSCSSVHHREPITQQSFAGRI